MNRCQQRNLVIAASLVLTVLLPVLASSPATATPPPHIDANALEVGDVVAVGTPVPGGCHFDTAPTISIRAPADDTRSRAMDLRTNDACEMTVHALTTSTTTTSTDITDPVYNRRSDDPNSTNTNPSSSSSASTMSTSKTVTNEVIHYGTSGKDERLTDKVDTITYTWDGTYATMTDDSGTCGWITGWHNDACTLDSTIEQAWRILRQSHGDYHWDPWYAPPGYYHTLTAYTYGYNDGDHACDYTWSGDIVNGVYSECTVS